jgi:hypothetical protein
MVQVDVPVAFAIGGLFADAARKQLQTRRPEYYYRAVAKNNLFQAFFFSWIPVYFLLNYFGWETTHMWWHADSVAAYPYYVPIFMVVFFLAANAGFWLGCRLVRAGRVAANRGVYLGIVAFCAVWIFGQTDRTFRLGSYAEWKAGAAPLFYQDRTFLFMLVFTLLVWGIALAVFHRLLARGERHLDPVVRPLAATEPQVGSARSAARV